MSIKKIIHKWFSQINRLFRPIIVKGKNNKVSINSKLRGTRVRVIGNNNELFIDKNCEIQNSVINIIGNNSKVVLKKGCYTRGRFTITAEDDAYLEIGENTGMRGVGFLVAHAKVIVGDNCMFSYGVNIRTTDGHKIMDLNTNKVINTPADVIIGNHVWIGKNVTILKGANIGHDTVVGYGSIVTKTIPNNVIVAGVPARVVKENVTWAK